MAINGNVSRLERVERGKVEQKSTPRKFTSFNRESFSKNVDESGEWVRWNSRLSSLFILFLADFFFSNWKWNLANSYFFIDRIIICIYSIDVIVFLQRLPSEMFCQLKAFQREFSKISIIMFLREVIANCDRLKIWSNEKKSANDKLK